MAPGVDAGGRVRARRPAACPVRSCQSAAASCERAEFAEQTNSAGPTATRRASVETAERVGSQVDVAAAAVAARTRPFDEPDPLEDVEVVGQQVRLDPEAAAQLDRRPVRGGQLVDDRQPDRVAERRVACCPAFEVGIIVACRQD